MVSEYTIEKIAKEIAGDIVWSSNPGVMMRKWREVFGVTQIELSRVMKVAPSVISDYEKGRRVPGWKFMKKYISTLLLLDEKRGWKTVRELAKSIRLPPSAVLDMREFSREVKLSEIVEVVDGEVLWGKDKLDKVLYGYTVLDSIASIESMTGNDFYSIMGMTTERALVFTNVGTGRSPMVAVRVSPLKPGAVIIHGPIAVDPLAVRLAQKDKVPLILSRKKSVEALISSLRALAEHKF